MMTRRWVLVAILFFSIGLHGQDRQTLMDQILENSPWELESDIVQYGIGELEVLVEAEDELEEILSYGFRGASQLEIGRGAGTVRVTLYEMIDSAAAYGIFALRREWTRPDFQIAIAGTESYRQDNELVFWQSNYVGRLAGGVEETAALAGLLTDQILGPSRKAPVSTLLPAVGLVPESEKYILTPELFAASTGVEPTDLGFENSVEVALAEYRRRGSAASVALLLYPTQHLASRHAEEWLAGQDPALPNHRAGPLFAIVTASDDPELTEDILTGVYYESEVTWNEALPDPLTLPAMILTIFTWIGLALLFTLIAGVGFGTLRVHMKKKYPGFVFGYESDGQIIQLNIDQQVTHKQLNQ